MKTDSSVFAAQLFHLFGNVGRTEDELLKFVPTEKQLNAAVNRVKQEAENAAETIRRHHNIKKD